MADVARGGMETYFRLKYGHLVPRLTARRREQWFACACRPPWPCLEFASAWSSTDRTGVSPHLGKGDRRVFLVANSSGVRVLVHVALRDKADTGAQHRWWRSHAGTARELVLVEAGARVPWGARAVVCSWPVGSRLHMVAKGASRLCKPPLHMLASRCKGPEPVRSWLTACSRGMTRCRTGSAVPRGRFGC